MRGLKDNNIIHIKFAGFQAEVWARQIVEEIDIEVLEDCLNSGRYEELNKHLSKYFGYQFEELMKWNGIFIPVPDEYLRIAVMSLIAQGKYYIGLKLLRYRESYDSDISAELNDIKLIAIFCRELSIAVYDEKDADKVKNILEENRGRYGELIDFKRAELWLIRNGAENDNDFSRLIVKAEDALNMFNNDGELMAYKAAGLYGLGKRDEAKASYIEAVNNTRNGFIWKEAKELFGIVPDGEVYEEEI